MSNGNNELGLLGGLTGLAGQYYLATQGGQDASAAGAAALAGGERIGQEAVERSTFQPFTVTSGLANVGTTPTGGLELSLSPEQQARQQQLLQQSANLFGRVGTDPTRATSEYFEAIRAAQRPEEERMRRGLDQSLFTRGRGGISTAEYGGTAEEFAFEKARQEAILNAAAGARQQALAEQQQAATMAGLLSDAAYRPQQEAIDLFGASAIPSQLAATGRTTGATLASQAQRSGIEGMLQGTQLSNLLERQAIAGALPIVTGAADSLGGYLFGDDGFLSGLFGGGDDFSDDFISTNAEVNPALNSSAAGGQASVAINPLTGNPYDTSRGMF